MKAPHMRILARAIPFLLALVAPPFVWADSKAVQPAVVPPTYRSECAACHLAYPPGLLPAASWSRIMNGLERHYGSDASLDAQTVQQLNQWLQGNAGTYKRVTQTPPPEDRITRSAWFVRKHRRIDTPEVWRHASVQSAANCAACHSQADQGRFGDGGLVFPEGLDARFRAAFQDD